MRCLATLGLLLAFLLTPCAARAESGFDLGRDKSLHFAVGLGLAGLGYAVTAELHDNPGLRLGVGAGLALTAGVAKELYDLAGYGEADWWDLAFDLLGACVGLLVALSIDRMLLYRARNRRSSPGLRSPTRLPVRVDARE